MTANQVSQTAQWRDRSPIWWSALDAPNLDAKDDVPAVAVHRSGKKRFSEFWRNREGFFIFRRSAGQEKARAGLVRIARWLGAQSAISAAGTACLGTATPQAPLGWRGRSPSRWPILRLHDSPPGGGPPNRNGSPLRKAVSSFLDSQRRLFLFRRSARQWEVPFRHA